NYVGYMNADRNVKVEEALEMIQRALALDPNNSAYLDSQGWAYFRLGRLEAAEESVRKALASQDKNAVILDHLGDILQSRGRTAEAVEYWQQALQGEDDEGELDRARVERKIRDAQSVLRAQQTP
ncbi:MAG TPA: tetratricopeptide repeat protein, partial [Vicinamibacteria bacterium]|nr:tetratricopeptide repeat protein [Vicinamibacteria bacterium]